jgi:hypothetical protein
MLRACSLTVTAMHPVPTPTSSPPPASVGGRPPRQSLPLLTLGALGVVYGDIGTSPLYTVKEVFAPATGVALNAANIVGAVSVIFWALMLVVTLKYVLLILRADNHGEGGALALAALAASSVATRPRLRQALLLLGVAGATLFYGDSIITPAISVLGAMEGLQVLTPSLAAARRAGHGADPARAVPGATAGHQPRRPLFGPVIVRLVPDAGGHRRDGRSPASRRSWRR